MENHTQFGSVTEKNEENNSSFHLYKNIAMMVISSVFCLVGVIGNGLVIWFGIFRMKKTVNVVWFLSLAIADFSFAFFSIIGNIPVILGYWPYERFGCKLIHYIMHGNMGLSVYQITVISIDRCIYVVFPGWCQTQRRPRLAFIIVLIIWIISLAMAIPTIMYADIILQTNNGTTCYTTLEEYGSKISRILDIVFSFLLPAIIIVSCYIVIILYARRKHMFASSKPLNTIVAVITAFIICWFPLFISDFLLLFEVTMVDSVVSPYFYISELLMVISCCINPILYVFIGRDFKDKICGLFQAKLEKAFIEEEKANCENEERVTTLQSLSRDYAEEVIG